MPIRRRVANSVEESMLSRARRFLPRGFPALLALAASLAPASDSVFSSTARDEEPVTISGAALSELAGRSLADLAMFRWDAAQTAFVPIPFQIDERVNHLFPGTTTGPFYESMYDVFGEDDGLLDADDEIVFLFGDGGPAAPAAASWPAAAEARRYEIVVSDPRAGAPVPERRAYLFTGPTLERSPQHYVQWDGLRTSPVHSSTWSIGFTDRWVLDSYRVHPPCGTGGDIIDRFKGRAGASLGMESEQIWNATSTYLGGIAGPVRAIRYVLGAASAVNTIHHDVIYRGFWERGINLRVHPIAAVAFYVDHRPGPNTQLFTDRVAAGVPVDGVPDAGMGTSMISWAVLRGPLGGYALQYDIPPSPFYGSSRLYYRDDVTHNDATDIFYDDEDNSSFGAQGVELRDLVGSLSDTIVGRFRTYPLCANVGDAAVGAGLQDQKNNPLAVQVLAQNRVAGPVRTLRAARSGSDIDLSWEAIPGVDGYRVYVAESAWVPQASWTLLGETAATGLVDAGGASTALPRHYSVVGVLEDDEGEW
jgi:hypothetical protein